MATFIHEEIHSWTVIMPPKAASKGAKKAVSKAKAARGGEGKKRRKRRRESYSIPRVNVPE